ncbi:MAG TPA: hypothetical protein VMM77_08430 [Gemmatimonadaceae bacterium]|nr:hypothetical protein [Gemmatimonadaceae bacterium]
MSAGIDIDPRDRFLRAIVEQISVDRIAEIHLFPALRSGGRESAVAVVAARSVESYVQGLLPSPVGEPEMREGGENRTEPARHEASSDVRIDPADQVTAGPPPEIHDSAVPSAGSHPSDPANTDFPPEGRAPRLVVYRAVYRWTRKGPDRGHWEVDITAEADAPLHAVGDVVRGVQRRAGEEGESELITPEALRIALSDRPWATGM